MPGYFGTLKGEFSVDPNGSAVYTIPLEVPPGTAGLAPSLLLVYNSAARNGLLGMGWRLHGLSSITRTGATMAQDGYIGAVRYDMRDRFVIDGSRLVAYGGEYGSPDALYRTEIETWRKIVPIYGDDSLPRSGPDSFIVYAKDGNVLEYGTVPNAQITASSENPSIRVWALNKITDRHGNYLVITYQNDTATNDYYPLRIDYTGSSSVVPQRSVRFLYESRPDPIVAYVGGYRVQTTLRLASIRTFLGDSPVMSYLLSYDQGLSSGRSRLQLVRQSDASGGELTPTRFAWQDSNPGVFAPVEQLAPTAVTWGGALLPLDVNGDGLVDFVYAYQDAKFKLQMMLFIAKPDGSGFSPGVSIEPTGLDWGGDFLPMDVNGDGSIDIVYATENGGDLGLTVFFATQIEGSWTLVAGPLNGAGPSGLTAGGTLLSLDVDGDGRTDLVYAFEDYPNLGLKTLFSDGFKFTPSTEDQTSLDVAWGGQCIPLDIDGDGQTDLVYAVQNNDSDLGLVLLLSAGRKGFVQQTGSAFPAGTSIAYGGSLLPMDVNADGNIDLVYLYAQTDTSGQQILELCTLLSTGTSFLPQPPQAFPTIPFGGTLLPMDVTGDGLTDLVIATPTQDLSGTSLTVILNQGTGFSLQSDVNQSLGGTPWGGAFLPLDLDGSGKTDLLYAISSGPDLQLALQRVMVPGPIPDMITAITNGAGGKIDIFYKPITDQSVYQKQGFSDPNHIDPCGLINNSISGATYQIQMSGALGQATPGVAYATRSVDFAKYVTARYTKTYAQGQEYAYDYSYHGAKLDLTGRGWLGFELLQQTDGDVGTTTVTEFHQTFPLTFAISNSTLSRTQDHALIERTIWTYEPRASVVGVYELLTTRTDRYLYNFMPPTSPPDASFSKQLRYDEFGNPVAELETATGMATIMLSFERKYLNDPDRWLFGYPTESVVNAVTDDGALHELSSERMAYDRDTVNLISRSVWEPQQGKWLATTYAYDTFGNAISVTDPSGATDSKEYDPIYHTFVTRATSPPNAAGETVATSYQTYPENGITKSVSRAQLSTDRSEPAIVSMQSIDGLGRVIETWMAGPSNELVRVTTKEWRHENGALVVESRALLNWRETFWKWSRRHLDGFERCYRMTEIGPDGLTPVNTDQVMDGRDLVVSASLPYYETEPPVFVNRVYDCCGRLTREERPAFDGSTSVSTFRYPTVDQQVRTDGVGSSEPRQTLVQFGIFNQKRLPIRQVDATGGITTRFHDGLGRLIGVTDPGGIHSAFAYDGLSRQYSCSLTDAKGALQSLSYRYDDPSRTVSYINGNGLSTTLVYDALRRLSTKVVEGEGNTTFSYDSTDHPNAAGRLAKVLLPDGTSYDYTYDANGNQATIGLSVDGVAYVFAKSYSPTGQVETTTFPDGSVQTDRRNAADRVEAIALSEAGCSVNCAAFGQFNAVGNAGEVTYGNGATDRFRYNAAGQLIRQTLSGPGDSPIREAAYAWNAFNELAQIADANIFRSWTFTYDEMGRLAATARNGAVQHYGYEPNGNVRTKDGIAYRYHGYQAMSGEADGEQVFSASYDGDGNMTRKVWKGSTTSYEYNASRQLIRTGGNAFSYDHGGARLVKRSADGTTTYYIGPLFEAVLFPNGGRQHTKYVFGPHGLIAAVTAVDGGSPGSANGVPRVGTFYFHRNFIGSTDVQTDENGTVVATAEYQPYGEVSVSGPNGFRQKFTGKEFDVETGLYYFGARYYDPQIGRFLTSDTGLGAPLDKTGALNRYEYALNNPINFTDPTGHTVREIFETISAYVVDIGMIAIGGVFMFSPAAGLGFAVVGSALVGAGFSGLAYNIQQNAEGKLFTWDADWQSWATDVAIGALTGMIAGGVAGAAAKVVNMGVSTGRILGLNTGKAIWEAGKIGRVFTNVGGGVIGNAMGGFVGEIASNAAYGRPVWPGVGGATLVSGVLGLAGGLASEGIARGLSRLPAARGYLNAAMPAGERQALVNAVRADYPGASTSIGSVFPRYIENITRNNMLIAMPGILFTGLDTGLYDTHLHPRW